MLKNMVVVPLVLLVGLSGCGGGKNAHKAQPKKGKTAQGMNESGVKGTNIGFFDENLEDMESFVLDQEAGSKGVALANNDELNEANFSLDESKQEAGLETQLVYFEYDKDDIRNDQKNTVSKVFDKVHEWVNKGYKVVFKGHSCKWHGTRAHNVALSNDRAYRMANMCKISKDTVKIFGVGNEEPVSFENSLQGQAPNRRVEIYPIAA